jgi:hypothetical protein
MTELINLELKSLNLGQEITSDTADNFAVTKKYVDELIQSEIIGVASNNDNFNTIDLELKALADLLTTNSNDIGDLNNPQAQAGNLVTATTNLTVNRKAAIEELKGQRFAKINEFATNITRQIVVAENTLNATGGSVIEQQNLTIGNLLQPIIDDHNTQQDIDLTNLFDERRQVVGHKEIICGAGKGISAISGVYQDPPIPLQSPEYAFNNRLDTWNSNPSTVEFQGYFSGKNTQSKSLTLEFDQARVCTEMHFWNNPTHWGSYTENGVEGEDYSTLHETPRELEIYGSNTRGVHDTTQTIINQNSEYVFLASFNNTADSYPYTKHVTNGFVSDNLNLGKVFKLNNTTAYKYYTIVVKSIIRVNTAHDYKEVEGLHEWCWSASEIAFIGDEISQSTIRDEISDSVQNRLVAVNQHINNHQVALQDVGSSVDNLTQERKTDLKTSRSFLGADITLDNFTVSPGASVEMVLNTSVFTGSNLRHAFDGATGQYPSCIVLTPDPDTHFATLNINCGEGLQRKLGRVAMWSRTDAKNENPSVVIIKGSNDNSVFTTLYSNVNKPFEMNDYPDTSETPVTGPVLVSDLTDKSLDLMIENPAPYQYYQIQMKGIGINGNRRVGIGELGLYERSVYDDIVAEAYFRNEGFRDVESDIYDLRKDHFKNSISIDIQQEIGDREDTMEIIGDNIQTLNSERGSSINSMISQYGNMRNSRQTDIVNESGKLNTAIQERESEVANLTTSRIADITGVQTRLSNRTGIIQQSHEVINADFTTKHDSHTESINSLVTDRQTVGTGGTFTRPSLRIGEMTQDRENDIELTRLNLNNSSAGVQVDLDRFNNDKIDKSVNYSGGDRQSFKIDEDSYLYIGKHWRIAANNLNHSNTKLEFEYSPDTINWILGAPLFNFDKES